MITYADGTFTHLNDNEQEAFVQKVQREWKWMGSSGRTEEEIWTDYRA